MESRKGRKITRLGSQKIDKRLCRLQLGREGGETRPQEKKRKKAEGKKSFRRWDVGGSSLSSSLGGVRDEEKGCEKRTAERPKIFCLHYATTTPWGSKRSHRNTFFPLEAGGWANKGDAEKLGGIYKMAEDWVSGRMTSGFVNFKKRNRGPRKGGTPKQLRVYLSHEG